MMMRYHLGLGVGHIYIHRSPEFGRSAPGSRQEYPVEVSNPELREDEDQGPSDFEVAEELRSVHSIDCSDWEDRLDIEELDAMDEMYMCVESVNIQPSDLDRDNEENTCLLSIIQV
jgi:hypothetical protein